MIDKKVKHLELIQNVINRMSGNSFVVKGWCVTLISGLLALSSTQKNPVFVLIAFFPLLMFWALDGFLLYQERLFRKHYDAIRKRDEQTIDFSMDTAIYKSKSGSQLGLMLSSTLILFYIPLAIAIIVVSVAIVLYSPS